MTTSLHFSDLVDACTRGRALFRAISGGADEITVDEWTPLHSIWLASAYPGYHDWLRVRGLVPRHSLRGVDLRGTNLADANLAEADLAGANLAGANLRGADLEDANLRGTNLADANLAEADLAGAYLVEAYLVGAYLEGAYRTSDPPSGWRIEDGRLRRVPSHYTAGGTT